MNCDRISWQLVDVNMALTCPCSLPEQPRSLQDLCRIKIRHCIGLQSLKLLEDLPIAKVMKDYLKHKFDHVWPQRRDEEEHENWNCHRWRLCKHIQPTGLDQTTEWRPVRFGHFTRLLWPCHASKGATWGSQDDIYVWRCETCLCSYCWWSNLSVSVLESSHLCSHTERTSILSQWSGRTKKSCPQTFKSLWFKQLISELCPAPAHVESWMS